MAPEHRVGDPQSRGPGASCWMAYRAAAKGACRMTRRTQAPDAALDDPRSLDGDGDRSNALLRRLAIELLSGHAASRGTQ
jgi:hypothetical protein